MIQVNGQKPKTIATQQAYNVSKRSMQLQLSFSGFDRYFPERNHADINDVRFVTQYFPEVYWQTGIAVEKPKSNACRRGNALPTLAGRDFGKICFQTLKNKGFG